MFGTEFFAHIGGVLMCAALVRYAIPIIQKKTRPVIASWAIWAGLDALTALGMYKAGTLNPQIAAAAGGAGVILLLAIRFGKSGWTQIDKICFMVGLAAIAGWYFSGNPTVAVSLSLLAVLIGCIPTFVSAMEDASREDKLAWVLVGASSAFTVASITHWTFNDAAQPLTFLGSQAVMLWILYVHPLTKRVRA